MALYQFFTYVFPKEGIIKKYGELPFKMNINHQERDKYYSNDDENVDEVNFNDDLSINWWSGIEIDIVKLTKRIDDLLPKSSWSETSWKIENDERDHDIFIEINDKLNEIQYFQSRIMLSDPDTNFLRKFLLICEDFDLVLMGEDGSICSPEIQDYLRIAKESRAYRFLNDPEQFFNDLANDNLSS